ncbi:hypothetical protein BJF85_18185 [Saccharomonospora sp. CUA-673]|uniref:hypothetical protein n=1 Tax=Saccharomonospora sp. CUA-673 TaxID=1904969 RepID=UPI00096600AB|nr:hypothetical protein [Saccharomonospora sp. CUA-673]OLT45908.1 hypothetical protein BJF85_18185 [Saccharomonospora sp. CUA-673]
MRADELLGAPVYDREGRRGVVIDVRVRADHELGRGTVLMVDGFVVGNRDWRLFGYERIEERGPALLQALIRWLHRHTRYAPWDTVDLQALEAEGLEAATVQLRCPWTELPRFTEV